MTNVETKLASWNIVGSLLIAFVVGYVTANGFRFTPQSDDRGKANSNKNVQAGGSNSKSSTSSPGDESEQNDTDEDDEDSQDLGEFAIGNEECKLVLVVRTDLGMGKGKIAAQCSHATLACYKTLSAAASSNKTSKAILDRWERLGQAKVATKVDSEDELLTLQAVAHSLGICARVIHDAGRTQIAAGSATVLGVGPAPKRMVDQVTGQLKLL